MGLSVIFVRYPPHPDEIRQRFLVKDRHRRIGSGRQNRLQAFGKKGPIPRRIGCTKGSPNLQLYAVCVGQGRPVVLMLSEGQISYYKGAALMLEARP